MHDAVPPAALGVSMFWLIHGTGRGIHSKATCQQDSTEAAFGETTVSPRRILVIFLSAVAQIESAGLPAAQVVAASSRAIRLFLGEGELAELQRLR